MIAPNVKADRFPVPHMGSGRIALILSAAIKHDPNHEVLAESAWALGQYINHFYPALITGRYDFPAMEALANLAADVNQIPLVNYQALRALGLADPKASVFPD